MSMEPQLPRGLLTWLHERGWSALRTEQVIGGFAAALYRIHLRTESGRHVDAIFKKFAPDRTQEYDLYDTVLPHLQTYAPPLVGRIMDDREQGVLIQDAGQPLKPLFNALRDADQELFLRTIVEWLAGLHVKYEEISQSWLHSRLLKTYPVDSSHAWADEAMNALSWLSTQNLVRFTKSSVDEIQSMVDRFYPKYPSWITGRMTITHGDPHLENILVQRGRLRLIDWEYTCISVPQRDLAILLQDVLNDNLHVVARTTYSDHLRRHGWLVDDTDFLDTYQACLFDNTLMMLGWEIHKFREGHLRFSELDKIVTTKLRWLRDSFQRLFD